MSIRDKFLTKEEKEELHPALDKISLAYWHVWGGKPLFNGKKVKQDLEEAKHIIDKWLAKEEAREKIKEVV